MIEVEVHYKQMHLKKDNSNDFYVYPYFLVKGHANNGTSKECIQVCAGVSACVIGVLRLINDYQYHVNYKSGLFEIKSSVQAISDKTYIDMDTNYALNTLLCQLYDLKLMYPSQFSRFEMIELKENEETNYEEPKPKPFRKLRKRKHMGLCTSE